MIFFQNDTNFLYIYLVFFSINSLLFTISLSKFVILCIFFFRFANILLEHMDQEAITKLKKEQEDAEDDAKEEEDSSDEEMETEEVDSEDDEDLDKTLWGEGYSDNNAPDTKPRTMKYSRKDHDKRNETEISEVSDAEKQLLMEEFRSNMFSNFLQGKDINFDYKYVFFFLVKSNGVA